MYINQVMWFTFGAIVGASFITKRAEAQQRTLIFAQNKSFRRRKAAVDQFSAHRRDGGGWDLFDNGSISVVNVPHFRESRYGVYFKDTDEYGMFSNFTSFSNDVDIDFYFRSNRAWEELDIL